MLLLLCSLLLGSPLPGSLPPGSLLLGNLLLGSLLPGSSLLVRGSLALVQCRLPLGGSLLVQLRGRLLLL